MRTRAEVVKLCNEWKQLKKELLECGDTVSLIVAEHAERFISTLEWILEQGQNETETYDENERQI